jgi:hypothetical protein
LRISGGTELEAWVEIRQPEELEAEELEVFDSLRLSVVVLVELAAEIAAEILAEVLAEVVVSLVV